MVLEHALISIEPGREAEFEAAYEKAREVITSSPGCGQVELRRGVENPSQYLLLVEWGTLEDHLVGFRESERFTRWRELIGPYFVGQPTVDHYQLP